MVWRVRKRTKRVGRSDAGVVERAIVVVVVVQYTAVVMMKNRKFGRKVCWR